MMLEFLRHPLRSLHLAWANRLRAKYGFRHCDFEGQVSEVRMYLHDLHQAGAHHFYLVGVLADSNTPCSFRLDRVRGHLTDLRTRRVTRVKAFLRDNWRN